MSRRFHETITFQHNAGIGEEVFDFRINDRVMTVDGLPGQVVARNSGPFASTEDYEVVLDGGMGGGSYTAAQLKKINTSTAALHEAAELVTASIPVEAITTHTADVDYPELGSILQERLPNENIKLAANQDEAKKPQSSQEDPGERLDQQDDETEEPDDDDTNTDTQAAEEPESEAGKGEDDAQPPDLEAEKQKNTPDVAPPSACSFCGADAFEDPQMTGRGVRMRCSQCGGTMKSWGGQWEPEFPNSPANKASEQGDWSQGGAAGVANAPGANFKTTKLQIESGIINWVVDKIYDRIEERKNHEILGKEWAWQTHFEGMPNHDTNYAQYCPTCGGSHAQTLHPEGLTIHGSLSDDFDSEWRWHFTASWADVRNKAKRIRKEGGVKILVANSMGVAGEVKGEHHVYESQLNYVVGTKHVADWSCGCKWASYAWGRSSKYRRFEGRLCSHALALQFEANARGMFGKQVEPDTDRPTWQKAHQPVHVQYQRPTSRAPEKEIRRRAVPPGNMKRTFSSLFHRSPDEHFSSGYEDGREFASGLEHPTNSIVGEAMDRLGDYAQTNPKESGHYIDGFRHGHDEHFGLPLESRMPWFRAASLDIDDLYESPELLDLYHAPIFASIQTMAEAGEPTENIIEMVASHGVTRTAAKEMIFEAFHIDDEGLLRDGDEYETPDGDRYNHGEPHDQDQWDDPEFVRVNQRDLTDHDGDEWQHDHHRTNDAREHAPHWGWGLPAGAPIETCGQCNGSGCGHCAGRGQVLSDRSNATAATPDQTSDAGDVISGLATNGALHTADYSSADPLAGVDDQTYYSPTNHSNSRNPASTGWATSQDPGDWGRSVITNNFGLTTDSAYHSDDDDEKEAPYHDFSDGYGQPVERCDSVFAGTRCERPAGHPRDHGSGRHRVWLNEQKNAALDAEPTVAGVLLRAKDTGRLLMIQRALSDGDKAAGLWEMPGGHLEDGEKPLHGAVREFEEETGHPFPQDSFVVHTWRSGPYRGHLVEVPSEQHLDFSRGRQIENPDGDVHEHVAWWDPTHAKKNPALRPEMKSAPWEQFKKAADRKIDLDAGDGGSMFEHRFAEPTHMRDHCATCARPLFEHEKAEGQCDDCLTSHEAGEFSGGHAEHVNPETGEKAHPRFGNEWNPHGYELNRLHTNSTLLNDPDEFGALPFTTGDVDGDVYPGQTGGSSGDASLPHASTDALHGDQGAHTIDSLHQAKLEFWETPAAQAMMADLNITKSAMKDFSYAEQQDLINEGHGARARNFNDLKIAGTHYEHLSDDDEDGDLFI